jgi:microcystin-dependent protein
MPLETGIYLADLVPSNPAASDGLNNADDHMRLIKGVLKNTFPAFTSVALGASQAQLDAAVAAVAGTMAFPFKPGTVALPGLFPLGDPNTGLYSPNADTVGIATNGTATAVFGTDKSTTLFGSLAASGPIIGAQLASIGPYSGGTGQLVPVGAVLEWYDDTLPAEGGYVWANGQIIASANTVCPILLARWGNKFGGNGVTTMGVPDRREVVAVGRSIMGGTTAPSKLSSIASVVKNVVGAFFGGESSTLVTGNLPAYTPSGSINTSTASTTSARSTNDGNGTGFIALTPSGSGAEATYVTSNSSSSFTGSPQGGASVPVRTIQPSIIANYILRLA